LQFIAALAEIADMTLSRALFTALLSCVSGSVSGQALFPSGEGGPPPAVTPVAWKWARLDQDTYFYFSGQENRPLVLSIPAAPGDGAGGFNEYLERYLVDEGYAVGILDWRGDFSRTAKPSAIVNRAFADLARIRTKNQDRFDSNRIILFGAGEGAFLATLLSADANRLQAADIPPASICAMVLLHPMNLNPAAADSFLARRQFAGDPQSATDSSPLRYASSAPPTLVMTQDLDSADEKRGNSAVAAFRSVGKTVVQTTYLQFNARNERTYFGWITNPATLKLGEFLRTYCPAKKS
jgi:hypothetical protein